jgi:putative transposase
VKGRKRHLLVDTLGLLLGCLVHPADVAERAGAKQLLNSVRELPVCSRLRLMWADSGYDGQPFETWVQQECGWQVEIVSKDPQQQGFAVLPKRWIVERTFSWLNKWRRLSKDYEQNPESSRACIQLAMIKLMLNRL